MFNAADQHYMARALELARRGLNTAHPNPRVGCVLVKDGAVVGEGWHWQAGAPHAEANALAAAGGKAGGATAYVTLEPCSHTGRTPPCADALIEARVARVVVAVDDPNPQVAGNGIERLRAAGIKVETGLLREAAEDLNCGFLSRMRRGRPWVRVKLAASLDGRTALASGESSWITGEAARLDVQRWRARSSTILTGIGTVLADNPRLDVRLPETERQPLRVVLDSTLRIGANAQIFQRAGDVLVLHGSHANELRAVELKRNGVQLAAVSDSNTGLNLAAVLRDLAEREQNEVWVEAGASLAGALVEDDLADELIVYLAPDLLGSDGRPLLALPGIERMDQRRRFEWQDMRRIGRDLRLILRPQSTHEE